MPCLRWRVGAVLLFVSLLSAAALAADWREALPVPLRSARPCGAPEFKIEWWYYTGNVRTAAGRRFGYQVTFFRVGIDPEPANPSAWAVRDLYMTHLAVSDPEGRRYRFDERLTRGGPGLSGAATDRYHVWNEDWSARHDAQGRHVIAAHGRRVGMDLTLDEGKPPVVNGLDGVSQKGAQAGNASHYYSLTRMPTRGTLTIDGERFEVDGESWMDREFGTSFLEPGQQGWDWLSLQLSDGRELMIYQLRRTDGSRDPRSSGTLTDAAGRATHLASADFTIEATGRTFRAPSGATYPIEWRITIPAQQLSMLVTTPLPIRNCPRPRQASPTGRASSTSPRRRAADLTGHGYLEMTGYKGSMGRVMTK